MEKKKVLFVATVVKTHIMEFHIPYLKMFQDMGWETAVAASNDYEDHVLFEEWGLPISQLPTSVDCISGKRPKSPTIRAFLQNEQLLSQR